MKRWVEGEKLCACVRALETELEKERNKICKDKIRGVQERVYAEKR